MQLKTKLYIGVLWLFTVSGILGILSPAQDWFLALTPLNLSISFLIILLNTKAMNRNALWAFSIPFVLGFVTEALGVNYGLLFGSYAYGENLGPKILGVPFMICINWCMLTIVTADLAHFFTKNKWLKIFLGASFMTLLDVVIEVSAPRFDFWEFENGIVPLQNYIAWLVIASLAHFGYQSFKVETHSKISLHVLASIFVFFAIFLLV